MKQTVKLILIILGAGFSAFAQTPSATPTVPISQEAEIAIKSSESAQIKPVKLSSPLYKISEKDKMVIIYLTATNKPKDELPKFQIVFLLRRIQFDKINVPAYIEGDAKNPEIAILRIGAFDLQLPAQSDSRANSEIDNTPVVIHSQNFTADLTAKEVELLLKTENLEITYRELRLSAASEGLKIMKEFIAAELQSFKKP